MDSLQCILFVALNLVFILNQAKAFDWRVNQLILYDPQTGRQMAPMQFALRVRPSPLFKVGQRRRPLRPNGNVIELPQLGNPCACTEYECRCCLGLQLGEQFNRKVCISLTYMSRTHIIQLRLYYNQFTILLHTFDFQNPPLQCIPIFVPLPLNICLRIYQIRISGGNVRFCLAFVLQLLSNQLFEYRMDCVSFGTDGMKFIKEFAIDVRQSEEEQQMQLEQDDYLSVGVVRGRAAVSKRRTIELEENYSGISLESNDNVDVKKEEQHKKGIFS